MALGSPHKDSREFVITRLVRAFEERLRRDFPDIPQTIDQIEEITQKIGDVTKQEIEQNILDAHGTGYTDALIPCSCGQMARYKCNSVRNLCTLHGEQSYSRAYYYCSKCKKGSHPLDQTLGLAKGQFSPRVRRLACHFATSMPFALAARELAKICRVKVSPSSVQRMFNDRGDNLIEANSVRQLDLNSNPRDPEGKAPKQMHISMDGVMIHAGGRWREVKLGVCYEREGDKGIGQSNYYATLAPSSQFGLHLKTLSWFACEPKCRKVAVIADGGEWIWQEVGKHFPGRVQILDYYHATEHLYAYAHARFEEKGPAMEEWVKLQKSRLLNDQVGTVISDMQGWQTGTDAHLEIRRKETNYFNTHSSRMLYKTLREAGYQIGSGVMESSCRWVVQQRMKGAGMRWSERGAERMLHLRTEWCGNKNEDNIM